MSTEALIERLKTAKNDIKNSIIAKGGSVEEDDGFESFSSAINNIPTTGGGGGEVDNTALIQLIDRSISEFEFPQELTEIGAYAFTGCTNLQEIQIPPNIKTIASYVFFKSGIVELTVPSTVETLLDYCFNEMSFLEILTIENGIKILPSRMCRLCRNLHTVFIPNTIERIGVAHLQDCTNLENVTLENGFNCSNLDLSASDKYSVETLVANFQALADRTGLTAYTIIIGPKNIEKLSPSQVAIATDKNWTVE